MEVYGTPGVQGSLKRIFEKAMPDAIYVDIHMEEDGTVTEKGGLTLAGRLARENLDKKIIMYGFEPIQKLWLDTNFRKAMTNINTIYVSLPPMIGDVLRRYSEIKFENPALNAIADIGYEKNLLGTLRHDYHHSKERVIKKAREELGWSGTDEEIEKKIMEYEPRAVVEPQFFPGVFCDIEGTLISEERLNENLAKELQEYSKEKPVNVWTGANLESVVPSLWKNKIEYPLLSKDWFKGCEAELVIDDLERMEFEKTFDIKAREYRKV